MKFVIPKDRTLSDSHDDDGFDVAAGAVALDPQFVASRDALAADVAEHFAFRSLVRLLRRDRGLSLAQLAEQARVDLAELVGIENDVRFQPRPRTIHQLAGFFRIPEKRLLELSNVTVTHSRELRDAAVRFAAKATNVLQLTPDERAALNEFVKFLGSQ